MIGNKHFRRAYFTASIMVIRIKHFRSFYLLLYCHPRLKLYEQALPKVTISQITAKKAKIGTRHVLIFVRTLVVSGRHYRFPKIRQKPSRSVGFHVKTKMREIFVSYSETRVQ